MAKPKIKKVKSAWVCFCGKFLGYGNSMQDAYTSWAKRKEYFLTKCKVVGYE